MRAVRTRGIISCVFEGLMQPMHLVVLLGIGLIVFGPGKLGELGGQLGRGVREFRDTVDGAAPRPPAAATAVARTCGRCSARADGGAAFCVDCGSRLGEDA